jgi:NAD-dependent dihydropyrimidine dehydrogenase PreA subunit
VFTHHQKETHMAHIISQPCIGTKDSACVEVCPVECIYEGDDQFYIHPDECIDCGACVPACPVSAIFPEEDMPADQISFIAKNRTHFGL